MRSFAFVAAAVVCVSCIVPAPSEKAQERAAQRAPAPPLEVKNGANLEDKIEIVGATITPGRAVPGDSLKVSTSYRVLDTLPSDYMIFVHIEDVDGRIERLNADHAPVGGSYPTSKWQKGETVRDDFTIYVPPGAPIRGINVLIGFWDQKTDSRLKLKNTDAVRNDGNNRILLAQVPVTAQQ